MVRACPHCAGKLLFDINLQRLSCTMCGSTFDVNELDTSASDAYLENDKVEKVEDTYDCYIYRCNQCGAEVKINGTESSTFCLYCGNPTIVFARMAKEKKPDFIAPFVVNKEQAVAAIRKKIGSGPLVPKEIKNFTIDSVKGIYIPYHLNYLTYMNSALLKSRVKSGKYHTDRYYLRSGFCEFDRILSDASAKLSDESSQRLEPYIMNHIRDFDEDYLVGYYSDMADVNIAETKNVALGRAKELFEEAMLESIHGSSREFIKQCPTYYFNSDSKTVLLPAWFLTFRYANQPHTIMVNGQTGKVVGAVPWNKAKLASMIVSLSILISIIATIVAYLLIALMGDMDDSEGPFEMLAFMFLGGISCFVAGINKYKKVKKSIERTTAATMFKYANNRQEGQV